MTADDRRWAAWLVAVVGSFAYLEGRAVRRRPKLEPGKRTGTLTDSVRWWTGRTQRKPRRFVFGALIGAFCFYLYTHLVHGWFDF